MSSEVVTLISSSCEVTLLDSVGVEGFSAGLVGSPGLRLSPLPLLPLLVLPLLSVLPLLLLSGLVAAVTVTVVAWLKTLPAASV